MDVVDWFFNKSSDHCGIEATTTGSEWMGGNAGGSFGVHSVDLENLLEGKTQRSIDIDDWREEVSTRFMARDVDIIWWNYSGGWWCGR